MIRSPSWTPAFTAAPPVKMKTGVLKCASTNNEFIQVQTTDLVTAFFSTSLAKIKLNLSCVLASHLVGRSALAWLSLHTLWSRNRAGPSARPRISGQDQDLGGWGWKDVKVVFWIFNDRKKKPLTSLGCCDYRWSQHGCRPWAPSAGWQRICAPNPRWSDCWAWVWETGEERRLAWNDTNRNSSENAQGGADWTGKREGFERNKWKEEESEINKRLMEQANERRGESLKRKRGDEKKQSTGKLTKQQRGWKRSMTEKKEEADKGGKREGKEKREKNFRRISEWRPTLM